MIRTERLNSSCPIVHSMNSINDHQWGLKNDIIIVTSLISTLRSVPSVSVLERFDCKYVLSQRVWFLGLFGLKLVYILPILVWNWVWILRKLREWILLFHFQMNTEKERAIYNLKWILRHLSFGVLISVMMTYLFLRDQVWNRYGF